MLFDYNAWEIYSGSSEGSGRSEKEWLINPRDGRIGVFKFPKSEHTSEHVSEKVACEIAKLIGVPCANIEIGIYGNRIGSMSYIINNSGEDLIEGVSLINKHYPSYNPETLWDSERKLFYCVDMILVSLNEYALCNEILKIMIFDFLIGNTDRHQNNWAVLRKENSVRMCPAYDNGSSLCCYVNENDIPSFLGKDKMRFCSLTDTKSKSRIRIDGKISREPTHREVLSYIQTSQRMLFLTMSNIIIENVNENNLTCILDALPNGVVSEERKHLIKLFLLRKVEIMRCVFGKEK